MYEHLLATPLHQDSQSDCKIRLPGWWLLAGEKLEAGEEVALVSEQAVVHTPTPASAEQSVAENPFPSDSRAAISLDSGMILSLHKPHHKN